MSVEVFIIFIVTYRKAFIFVFELNFLYKPATANLANGETLQLRSTTSEKLYYTGGLLNFSMEI